MLKGKKSFANLSPQSYVALNLRMIVNWGPGLLNSTYTSDHENHLSNSGLNNLSHTIYWKI